MHEQTISLPVKIRKKISQTIVRTATPAQNQNLMKTLERLLMKTNMHYRITKI